MKELNMSVGVLSWRIRTLFVDGVGEILVWRNYAGNVQQNILLCIVPDFHDCGFVLVEAIPGGSRG